jgi:hypothetical protein
VLLTIGVAGCDKKSGEAVVLSKEHIDAAPPTQDTSNTQSMPGPEADDEIEVDGHVRCAARAAIRVRQRTNSGL